MLAVLQRRIDTGAVAGLSAADRQSADSRGGAATSAASLTARNAFFKDAEAAAVAAARDTAGAAGERHLPPASDLAANPVFSAVAAAEAGTGRSEQGAAAAGQGQAEGSVSGALGGGAAVGGAGEAATAAAAEGAAGGQGGDGLGQLGLLSAWGRRRSLQQQLLREALHATADAVDAGFPHVFLEPAAVSGSAGGGSSALGWDGRLAAGAPGAQLQSSAAGGGGRSAAGSSRGVVGGSSVPSEVDGWSPRAGSRFGGGEGAGGGRQLQEESSDGGAELWVGPVCSLPIARGAAAGGRGAAAF